MRIRSSSDTARSAKAGAAKGTKGAKGAGFAQMVTRTAAPETTEEVARHVRSALLDELLGVAKELAEGKGDKQETARRFVSAVIRDRFKELKGAGAKNVVESVADLINRDEALAARLQSQLLRLAAKK